MFSDGQDARAGEDDARAGQEGVSGRPSMAERLAAG